MPMVGRTFVTKPSSINDNSYQDNVCRRATTCLNWKKEIDALVKSGYYSSKSDVVKDALRYILDNKKNLRLAASIQLYKTGEVSLGKAAEIANMGVIEFKERLKDFGITRVIEAEGAKKMDAELAKIKRKYG